MNEEMRKNSPINMKKIEIRKEELEEFMRQNAELLFHGEKVFDQFNVMECGYDTMYDGKPYYLGKQVELMKSFHKGYQENVWKLNSLYSKLFEYLNFTLEQMGNFDEDMAKLIACLNAEKGAE